MFIFTHYFFSYYIFLSVNWMYLIFLSAPSLFYSNILFKASIHAKAIYLQMFHHFELLLYLDILHVLNGKWERREHTKIPKKILQVRNWPDKKEKENKHLFYGFEISWRCCSMAGKKIQKSHWLETIWLFLHSG